MAQKIDKIYITLSKIRRNLDIACYEFNSISVNPSSESLRDYNILDILTSFDNTLRKSIEWERAILAHISRTKVQGQFEISGVRRDSFNTKTVDGIFATSSEKQLLLYAGRAVVGCMDVYKNICIYPFSPFIDSTEDSLFLHNNVYLYTFEPSQFHPMTVCRRNRNGRILYDFAHEWVCNSPCLPIEQIELSYIPNNLLKNHYVFYNLKNAGRYSTNFCQLIPDNIAIACLSRLVNNGAIGCVNVDYGVFPNNVNLHFGNTNEMAYANLWIPTEHRIFCGDIYTDSLLSFNQWDNADDSAMEVLSQHYVIDGMCFSSSRIIEIIKSGKHLNIYFDILKLAQGNVEYCFGIHGEEHAKRVALLSYTLLTMQSACKDDIYIAIVAALLHDIGRTTNAEDPKHGYYSAQKAEGILAHLGIISPSDCGIVKGIIAAHSMNDHDASLAFNDFCIESDKTRFYEILSIIKDADALDRFRLSSTSLNPAFLRTRESSKLIRFAWCCSRIIAAC